MGYDAGSVGIYSNDGSVYFGNSGSGGSIVTYTVTSTGLDYGYTYTGGSIFMGFATEPNATTPTYAIGTTFYPNTNPPGESPANVKLYIVEKSVRNLTNTTWKIKEGWSCEAGYGQFNINFINKSGTSGAQYPIWPEFNIGYSYINEDGDMGATPNVIAVQFGGLVYGGGGYPFTISIVGGNDVENPDLIAWLEENGELQKVTNLTGSTWEIPSGWSASAGYGKFNVDFEVYTPPIADPYTPAGTLYIGYVFNDGNEGENYTPQANYIHFWKDNGALFQEDNSKYLAICFGDGIDATNTNLINWLYTNGYMTVLPTEEEQVTDLTNTTWEINSGWSAEVGYGMFSVNGTVNSENTNRIHIGYDEMDYGTARTNYISYFNTDIYIPRTIRPSSAIALTITGGTDATNTRLIDWLYEYGELVSSGTTTKKFTRIYLGETTHSSNGKRWRKLQDDEVVGTWILNAIPTKYTGSQDLTVSVTGSFYAKKSGTEETIAQFPISTITLGAYDIIEIRSSSENTYAETFYSDYYNEFRSSFRESGMGSVIIPAGEELKLVRTLVITGASRNRELAGWLKVNAQRRSEYVLCAPTISLTDTTLNIVNNDIFATNYDILVNGEVKATVNSTTTSYDIEEFNLCAGTHSITVVAKATGYKTSVASTAVEYTILAPGLYSKENNLITSWETLTTTNGMDVTKDYTQDDYDTDPASPYCVLDTFNNGRLLGAKLVIGNVTKLGNNAFRECAELESVTIPYSVTSIGDSTFRMAAGLESINIPNSVTSIGEGAFSTCTSLQSIEISNSITSIPNDAFNRCTSLTRVSIPNSVTSIGEDAFSGYTLLTNINYNGTKEQWNAINKHYQWNIDVPATSVCCTDGTVAL